MNRNTVTELLICLVILVLTVIFLAYGLPFLKANYENFFMELALKFKDYIITILG